MVTVSCLMDLFALFWLVEYDYLRLWILSNLRKIYYKKDPTNKSVGRSFIVQIINIPILMIIINTFKFIYIFYILIDFENFAKYVKIIQIHLNHLMYFNHLKSENEHFEKDDKVLNDPRFWITILKLKEEKKRKTLLRLGLTVN